MSYTKLTFENNVFNYLINTFQIKSKCIARYWPVLPTLQSIAPDGRTRFFFRRENPGRVLCANPLWWSVPHRQNAVRNELCFAAGQGVSWITTKLNNTLAKLYRSSWSVRGEPPKPSKKQVSSRRLDTAGWFWMKKTKIFLCIVIYKTDIVQCSTSIKKET